MGSGGRPRSSVLFLLALLALLFLAGCGSGQDGVEGQITPQVTVGPGPAVARATDFVLPTLYPTFTRPANPATATPVFPDTPTAGPTVNFEQKVIELRYTIPALGLDRRLEGDISGRVTVVDEQAGMAALLPNQSGALLEMQQALSGLVLEPLPDGCERCVAFSYEMPVEGSSAQGWLQDPVLLGSIENYTTLALGPHFPPGTVLGLRRSASPYKPAHSLALTSEGELWRWLATEAQINEPLPAAQAAPGLAAQAEALSPEQVAAAYRAECANAPVETLYLNPDGQGSLVEEVGQAVRLVCPAFSLPTTLLPLYLALEGLLADSLEGVGLETPPPGIPLETLLDYRRADDTRLTLLLDGRARATSAAGEVITVTLEAGQALSLTRTLDETDLLQPGLEALGAGQLPVLLVRTPQGLLEAAWEEEPPAALKEAVAALDRLLLTILEGETPGAAEATVPAPVEPTVTAETPAPTPVGTETVTP